MSSRDTNITITKKYLKFIKFLPYAAYCIFHESCTVHLLRFYLIIEKKPERQLLLLTQLYK